MRVSRFPHKWFLRAWIACCVVLTAGSVLAQEGTVHVLSVKGLAQVRRPGQPAPIIITTNTLNQLAPSKQFELLPGDRVSVDDDSRLSIRWHDNKIEHFSANSIFEVAPAKAESKPGVLKIFTGILFFFHRDDEPVEVDFETPLVSAAIRGTEFVVAVAENGQTTVTVLDGIVVLTNGFGQLVLTNGHQGVVEPNQPPRLAPRIDAIQAVQWLLYYPGVLDPAELNLDNETAAVLAQSLSAYRDGDLYAAHEHYPDDRDATTDGERVYHSALRLSMGDVDAVDALDLAGDPNEQETLARLQDALRRIASAVKRRPHNSHFTNWTYATEWMAVSYERQASGDLPGAREAAREAVKRSPEFGFAHVRLAELEFGFANNRAALASLEHGSTLR